MIAKHDNLHVHNIHKQYRSESDSSQRNDLL